MADNPLLDLYSKQPGQQNPFLSLYSSEGQQPPTDLGDQPKPKQQIQGLAPQPQGPTPPGTHGNPLLIQKATAPEGQVAKEGQTVQQPDIKKDIEQTRESAVQAGAEVTGVADLKRLYSGEITPVEALPAAIMASTELKGASAIKNILSPGSTAMGRIATLGLRKATGEAARLTETTRDMLLPYEQTILSLPQDQQLSLIGYMEGRSKGKAFPVGMDPKLSEFADQFRNQMEIRKNLIQMHGIDAGVVEDYVTHLWKDRNKAAEFVKGFQARQGSGASLKERTIPTIEEGIRAGLDPITTNPVEIAMRYVTAMDRHIGLRAMIDAGESAGTVKQIGQFRDVPEGWVQLKGMVEKRNLYAPEDWARIWNNFVSKGVYNDPALGDAYQGFRNISNLTVQSILGFSGYHAMAMTQEAIASDLAKGIGQFGYGIRRGSGAQLLRGTATVAKSPVAPITKYLKGRKFRDIYLGRTANAHIADIFAEAGGRGVGKGHAFDYTFAPAGSFSGAWHRGYLKAEMRQAPGTFTSEFKRAAQDVWNAGEGRGAAYKAGAKAAKTAKETTNLISRSMSTIMSPLFEEYIPMLKNGAFADEFASWLEMNPQATHEQQIDYAAKLIDSIDNRFGEMIQDNIMWHTLLKQLATIGMLSYSWNLGSLRAFSGAANILRDPRALDPTSKKYSPNAAWVVAFPMATAMMSAAYQYLKTGKPPETAKDLIWPQTGGMVPGFGQRGEVPERAILPGYIKEPFGWYYNGVNEAVNKANPFLRMGIQALTNSDWKGDAIVPPDPTVPEWLRYYFDYVVGSMVPITLGRVFQGEAPGSKQGLGEELTGIRPGPMYGMDPNYGRAMNAIETTKWIKKLNYDRKHKLISEEQYQAAVRAAREKQLKYGGPQQ